MGGSVHGVIDQQDDNYGAQNDPVGKLNAYYRSFPVKPFRGFPPCRTRVRFNFGSKDQGAQDAVGIDAIAVTIRTVVSRILQSCRRTGGNFTVYRPLSVFLRRHQPIAGFLGAGSKSLGIRLFARRSQIDRHPVSLCWRVFDNRRHRETRSRDPQRHRTDRRSGR